MLILLMHEQERKKERGKKLEGDRRHRFTREEYGEGEAQPCRTGKFTRLCSHLSHVEIVTMDSILNHRSSEDGGFSGQSA